MKAKYVAPTLRAHGTLEDLTQANRRGAVQDLQNGCRSRNDQVTFS